MFSFTTHILFFTIYKNVWITMYALQILNDLQIYYIIKTSNILILNLWTTCELSWSVRFACIFWCLTLISKDYYSRYRFKQIYTNENLLSYVYFFPVYFATGSQNNFLKSQESRNTIIRPPPPKKSLKVLFRFAIVNRTTIAPIILTL